GYPITAAFPTGGKVEGLAGALKTEDGENVKSDFFCTYYHTDDGQPGLYCCLLPFYPLETDTHYRVHFAATIDVLPWRHSSQSSTVISNDVPEQETAASILKSLNLHRRIAGLRPCHLSPTLSRGCVRHVRYLQVNCREESQRTLAVHDQHPHLPGFSLAGR